MWMVDGERGGVEWGGMDLMCGWWIVGGRWLFLDNQGCKQLLLRRGVPYYHRARLQDSVGKFVSVSNW